MCDGFRRRRHEDGCPGGDRVGRWRAGGVRRNLGRETVARPQTGERGSLGGGEATETLRRVRGGRRVGGHRADSGREVGGKAERERGQEQNRREAVRDKVSRALVSWHARCYSPQGHTVESGDGQGRGLAFGGRDISVSSGPSRDQPIRTATDRPKRKGETLDAEAGNGRSQDSEQVVAGPLCVSRGGGAGSDEVAH